MSKWYRRIRGWWYRKATPHDREALGGLIVFVSVVALAVSVISTLPATASEPSWTCSSGEDCSRCIYWSYTAYKPPVFAASVSGPHTTSTSGTTTTHTMTGPGSVTLHAVGGALQVVPLEECDVVIDSEDSVEIRTCDRGLE